MGLWPVGLLCALQWVVNRSEVKGSPAHLQTRQYIAVHARLVSNDSTVLLSLLQFYHIFTLVESVRGAVYQVLGNGRGSALRANDAPINESASTDECGICMDSVIEIGAGPHPPCGLGGQQAPSS
jgi:hypothetical protein